MERTAIALLLILFFGTCVQATEVIVHLGDSVNLTCNSNGELRWKITDNDDESYYIHPIDAIHNTDERGFFAWFVYTNRRYTIWIQVPGTIINNQTQIDCTSIEQNTNYQSNYIFVIGPPEKPVEVKGWLVGSSPSRLRLEWQEPFSHHPITNYTVYTSHGPTLTTPNTTATLTLSNEESSICNTSDVGVTASNDVGESSVSPLFSAIREVADLKIAIEGNILSQNEENILKLDIKFPELCTGQMANYTLEVREEKTGRIVHQETGLYQQREVVYNVTITSEIDVSSYSVIVSLYSAEGQSTTSLPVVNENDSIMTVSVSEETETETTSPSSQDSNTDLLLAVIAVLGCAVICFLVVTVVVITVFVKSRMMTKSQVPKVNENPIYEGPLYENVTEEQPLPPPPPPPLSDRRRLSKGFRNSVDNIYHSSPVAIPGQTDELYAELTDKERVCHMMAGEEDTYTVMRSVGSARRHSNSVNATPYLEDRTAWISHKD